MAGPYPSLVSQSADASSEMFFTIVPETPFPFTTRSIYVGGVGGGATVIARRADGVDVTFNGCVAGSTIPVMAIMVRNTSTANLLVGLA
jgi:hypothetical protein